MRAKTRAGFSMIELIFAIVIIAILATYAIPKLTATKDDATASIIKRDATKLLETIQSYYYSQGAVGSLKDVITIDGKWTLLSNSSGQSNLAYGYLSEGEVCLVVELDVDLKLNLLVADEDSNSSNKCELLREIYTIDAGTTGTFVYDFENSSATGAKKKNFVAVVSTPLNASGINW